MMLDEKTMKTEQTKETVEARGQQAAAVPASDSASRFHADMPVIPGVPSRRRNGRTFKLSIAARIALAAVVMVLVGGTGSWLALRGHHANTATNNHVTPEAAPQQAAASVSQTDAQPATEFNEIGKMSDFPAPWSAKKFIYSRMVTHEAGPAIAIRLPVGNGRTSESYWSILQKAPYAQCDLDYITDVKEIATRFNFTAKHPLIADSCSNILYDPMRTATLADGSWARGEIVLGYGVRPPLQIEVRIEGDKLIAGRSED